MSGAAKSVEGFQDIQITKGLTNFQITYDQSVTNEEALMKAIEEAGELVHPTE